MTCRRTGPDRRPHAGSLPPFAFWVTFRAADGTDEVHHFEVDERGTVRVWETWLTKGALIMQGHVMTDGHVATARG